MPVSRQDIQRWMVWLLGRYSDSYASSQYRALQQFFKWWAGEEGRPEPMAKLRPPRVTEKLITYARVQLAVQHGSPTHSRVRHGRWPSRRSV